MNKGGQKRQVKIKRSSPNKRGSNSGYKLDSFLPKFLIFIVSAILILSFFIFQPQLDNHVKLKLSLPHTSEDRTTSSSSISNTVSDFIISNNQEETTTNTENKLVENINKTETKIITDDINNPSQTEIIEATNTISITEGEYNNIINYLKYLEQKIQDLETEVNSTRYTIEKEYRNILALALLLKDKIYAGSSFNREIILLQLETDDIFINSKIVEISDFAIDGTYNSTDLHKIFSEVKIAIIDNYENVNSSPLLDVFGGLISVKKKHKVANEVINQLDLIESYIDSNEFSQALELTKILPLEYNSLTAKFVSALKETILARKSVNEILQYLDV